MLQKRSFRVKFVRISLRAALVLISPFVLLQFRKAGSASIIAAQGDTLAAWYAAHEESELRQSVVEYARQLQGLPYLWGSKKPFKGIDCSGFTQYVWNRHNISLPEGAAGQFDSCATVVPLDQAKAGDLVFFRESPKAMVTHVALVVEADSSKLRVLHSVTSRGVIEEDLLQSPYWRPRIDEVHSGQVAP